MSKRNDKKFIESLTESIRLSNREYMDEKGAYLVCPTGMTTAVFLQRVCHNASLMPSSQFVQSAFSALLAPKIIKVERVGGVPVYRIAQSVTIQAGELFTLVYATEE